MKVELKIEKHYCIVQREAGEKRCGKETEFYVRLKRTLQDQGHDVIKKLIQKDGHLMGDQYQYYIRERKWKFAVYDGKYALRFIHTAFNHWETIQMPVAAGDYW